MANNKPQNNSGINWGKINPEKADENLRGQVSVKARENKREAIKKEAVENFQKAHLAGDLAGMKKAANTLAGIKEYSLVDVYKGKMDHLASDMKAKGIKVSDDATVIDDKKFQEREEMYRKMEVKVGAIEEMKQFVKDNEKLSPEEFKTKLEAKASEVKARVAKETGMTEDEIDKARELYSYDSEIERVNKEIQEYKEVVASTDSEKLKDKYSDEIKKARQQKSSWLASRKDAENEILNEDNKNGKNDDINFLRKVDFFVDDISSKKDTAYKLENLYKNNKDSFFKKIALINPGFKLDGNESVIFDGTVINIAVKNNNDNWESGSALSGKAIVVGGYPICFHRDGVSKKVLEHEKNHVLAESFDNSDKKYRSHDGIMSVIKNKLSGLGYNSLDDSDLVSSLRSNIIKLADASSYEILADVDNIGQGKMEGFIGPYSSSIDDIDYYAELINDKNPKLSEKIRGFISESGDKFSKNINTISDMFYVAKDGGKLNLAVNSLILFGGQNNFIPKAERFFRNSYGANDYDIKAGVRPILSGSSFLSSLNSYRGDNINDAEIKNGPAGFFAPKNISRLKNALSLDDVSLDPDDKKEIVKNLNNNFLGEDASDTVLSDVESPEDFYQGQSDLAEIADKLDLPELKQIGNREENRFIDKQVDKALGSDDFSNLQKIADVSPDKKAAVLNKLQSDEVKKKYNGKNLNGFVNGLANNEGRPKAKTAGQSAQPQPKPEPKSKVDKAEPSDSKASGGGFGLGEALSGKSNNTDNKGVDFEDDSLDDEEEGDEEEEEETDPKAEAKSASTAGDFLSGKKQEEMQDRGDESGVGQYNTNEAAMATQLREEKKKEEEKIKMQKLSRFLAQHRALDKSREGASGALGDKLVDPEYLNRAGLNKSASELREVKNKEKNQAKGRVGVEDGQDQTSIDNDLAGNANNQAGQGDVSGQSGGGGVGSKGTKWLLRVCWINIFTPWSPLCLFYINIHAVLAQFILPGFFCKLGEEWSLDDLSSMGGKMGVNMGVDAGAAGKTVKAGLGYAEFGALCFLDMALVLIIAAVLGVVVMIFFLVSKILSFPGISALANIFSWFSSK